MLKLFALAAAGLCLALGATPALAGWETTIGPVGDNNGDAAVMNGEADAGRWFQFWCRGDQRRIAILVEDGQNDDPAGLTAVLEITTDTGGTWRSEGDFYRHADGWLGLSFRDLRAIDQIVDDIIGARGQVAATIFPGEGAPIAVVATAQGSTKAGRAFAEFCFGATPVAAPGAKTQIQQQVDQTLADAAELKQQADQGLIEADEALRQAKELRDSLPEFGKSPWRFGVEGQPPTAYAMGEGFDGDALFMLGCEVGSGQLLLTFNGKPGISMPPVEQGGTLIVIAQTDFGEHVLLTQFLQKHEVWTMVVGTGEAADKVMADLILGSQKLTLVISTPDGSQAAERDIGVIDAGLAAARVREQCLA